MCDFYSLIGIIHFSSEMPEIVEIEPGIRGVALATMNMVSMLYLKVPY